MESFITCRDGGGDREEEEEEELEVMCVFMIFKCHRTLRLSYVRLDGRLAAACGRRGRTSSRAPRCWREEAG